MTDLELVPAEDMLRELQKRPNLQFVFIGTSYAGSRIDSGSLTFSPSLGFGQVQEILDKASLFLAAVEESGESGNSF